MISVEQRAEHGLYYEHEEDLARRRRYLFEELAALLARQAKLERLRSEGTRQSAHVRRNRHRTRDEKIRTEARRLEDGGEKKGRVAGKLAKKYELSKSQIRRILHSGPPAEEK